MATGDSTNGYGPQKTMELHIHGTDIYTDGLPNLGYKFVILTSLSTNMYEKKEGTYLSIDLVRASDTANLNGKQCGSGSAPCNTDKSLFSGDSESPGGANKTYTFTNIAMLENVKAIASDQCQTETGSCDGDMNSRLSISVWTSHEDIGTMDSVSPERIFGEERDDFSSLPSQSNLVKDTS